MRTVFVDTSYWVATANPKDQWASAAREVKKTLGDVRLVTTDEVLVEFLNFLSKYGRALREVAVRMVREVLDNPNVDVVHQSRDPFLRGMELYRQRADSEYSLVDCVSVNAIKARSLQEVLTADDHFAHEGFTVLIRP